MVGMEVASVKLRELLRVVLLLPEEAQDQVADAVELLVQQLLLASRLSALPAGVLSLVTRKAGRPTRRASKVLQVAYGPLDCGIRWDGFATTEQLSGLLVLHPRRFEHITSLVLTSHLQPYPADMAHPAAPYSDGFMSALASAIPKLRSLSASGYITSRSLQGLAPLAPHLTSLTLSRASTCRACLASVLQFTALRGLAIPLFECIEKMEDLLLLGSLQQLRALEWLYELLDDDPAARYRLLLSWLSCLSSLTSLCIHPMLAELEGSDLHALRTAWPHLSTLGLASWYLDADEAVRLMAALSQRTGLTALQVRLEDMDTMVDLRCLSSLRQLGKLSFTTYAECVLTESMGQFLEGMSALTSLHLEGYYPDLFTGPAAHPHLLIPRLQTLSLAGDWADPGDLNGCLGRLTMLTRLKLEYVRDKNNFNRETGLSHLTGLRALKVSSLWCTAVGVVRLLREVAALTRLQELALYSSANWDETMYTDDAANPALQHLLPLQHTLTRLAVGGCERNGKCEEGAIRGLRLAVVGKLTCLQELTLCHMDALRSPDLHEHLLPLPPSLRRLELQHAGWPLPLPLPGVQAALQAAADKQDCGVRVGAWV